MTEPVDSSEFNLQLKVGDKIGIFGKSGSGKTYFLENWLIPELMLSECRILIINSLISPNYSKYFITASDFLKNGFKKRKLVWCIAASPESVVELVGRLILERKRLGGYYWLILDECQLFLNERTFHTKSMQILPTYTNVGRNFGLGLVYASQRPQNIAKDLISNAMHLILFRITAKRDLDALSVALSSLELESVQNLEPRYFAYKNLQTGSELTLNQPV